jgi:hypothetical protein
MLYICPDPDKNLYIYNNYEELATAYINLIISPNYEIEKDHNLVNQEVGNFILGKNQLSPNLALDIIDGAPITNTTDFEGWF